MVLLVCVDYSIHRSAIGRPVDFTIIFILDEALDCLHSVDRLAIRPLVPKMMLLVSGSRSDYG